VKQYLDSLEKSDKSRMSLLDAKWGELRQDREAANSILST